MIKGWGVDHAASRKRITKVDHNHEKSKKETIKEKRKKRLKRIRARARRKGGDQQSNAQGED
jgi:hypothetical protein